MPALTRNFFEGLRIDGSEEWYLTVVSDPTLEEPFRFSGRIGVKILTDQGVDLTLQNVAVDPDYPHGSGEFTHTSGHKAHHIRFHDAQIVDLHLPGGGVVHAIYPAPFIGENIFITNKPEPVTVEYADTPRVGQPVKV